MSARHGQFGAEESVPATSHPPLMDLTNVTSIGPRRSLRIGHEP
jgi:hypothetical protein